MEDIFWLNHKRLVNRSMKIVHYVKKDINVTTRKAITKINRILNHNKIENMDYAY